MCFLHKVGASVTGQHMGMQAKMFIKMMIFFLKCFGSHAHLKDLVKNHLKDSV